MTEVIWETQRARVNGHITGHHTNHHTTFVTVRWADGSEGTFIDGHLPKELSVRDTGGRR